MAIGSWKAPLPLRLGGGGTRDVDAAYKMIRANRPEILRVDQGSTSMVEVENKAMARLASVGWRAIRRRVNQWNPDRLNSAVRPVSNPETGAVEDLSPLERWERILGVPPRYGSSLAERRANVKAKFISTTSNARGAIEEAMQGVFGSWYTDILRGTVNDVDYSGKSPAGTRVAKWLDNVFVFNADYPGEYDANYPWMSTLSCIIVRFTPPQSADDNAIRERVSKAAAVLDDMLPAWATASIFRLNASGSFNSRVDLTPLEAIAP